MVSSYDKYVKPAVSWGKFELKLLAFAAFLLIGILYKVSNDIKNNAGYSKINNIITESMNSWDKNNKKTENLKSFGSRKKLRSKKLRSRKRSKKLRSRKRSKKLRSKKHRSRKRSIRGLCKLYLGKKIAINMREFKNGNLLSNGRKITSRKQALAISYSQVRKKYPKCKF